MGEIKESGYSKLIAGFMYTDEIILNEAIGIMKERFGEIEDRCEPFDFNYTKYYDEEMGPGIKKIFVSFGELVLKDSFSEIKKYTNDVEEALMKNGKRRVNIDPSYMTDKMLVIASTKESGHRVAIGNGIYAEVALIFANGSWMDFFFTYADYKDDKNKEFFSKVRSSIIKNQST